MNFISKRPLFTAAMIFLVTGVLSYYADRKLRVMGIIALFGAFHVFSIYLLNLPKVFDIIHFRYKAVFGGAACTTL